MSWVFNAWSWVLLGWSQVGEAASWLLYQWTTTPQISQAAVLMGASVVAIYSAERFQRHSIPLLVSAFGFFALAASTFYAAYFLRTPL